MSTTTSTTTTLAWHDVTSSASDRAEALLAELTLEEKIAQLFGVWVGASNEGGDVAPHQNDMDDVVDLDALLPNGLGQLTRPFGSAPVDPALGALSLLRSQRRIAASNRFGIPAVAHEECLAGFATWGATAYPVPLAWGASFNPGLIERMSHRIGSDMRSVGIHQGLAPVLDVVRDARWGRVEETIGEDPYLIGTIGTSYVRGLESAGIVATLKHFVGYSASKAGRNLAPVSVGPRELADVLLVPFEMVMREGKPRSVMHSYTDIDGVPSAADESLLTGVLRDTWGFDGTVVADYFGIAFLKLLHGVAGSWGEAAALALTAGVDVELPTVKTFGAPLVEAVRSGDLPEAVIDRALRRVLRQKAELGLLDPDWDATPTALRDVAVDNAEGIRGTIDLDNAGNRAVAREIAEQSIVLVSNDGTLPLAGPRRIAVVGPTTDDPFAVLGCYSFPAHVGVQHPDTPLGIKLPTLLDSLRIEFPEADIEYVPGTTIDGGETAGISAAVDAAMRADVVIVALGDRAGLFGRGTSGEGCDVESLRLPGAQQNLLDAVLATSTPAVVTLLAGRPYALGSAVTGAAAIVQAFFSGEEGTAALAGILSGRVNPSGRLPVSIPASEGTQPSTYLAAPLARSNGVSSIDPTAAFAFGHGIGYTTFDWSAGQHGPDTVGVDGTATLGLRLRNTGDRSGSEIVQVYVHDPVASVVRPVQRLIGFQRVDLLPGESVELSIHVPTDVTCFTGRNGERVVEPGGIVLALGASSTDLRVTHSVQLSGEARVVGFDRAFHPRFIEVARTAS
ncbi:MULTISPECIES: beta-glucosidase family protein [unclassified Arthrobacter]|uniref:beta-xylosidase/alpha-l-arabinosidase n=1 Tax=unclassified Arthrobacter TaxID=235627 RepID=UPI0014911A64|nr:MULTISPECIES: glycoside hydrolase family 3 N-terminal domain-containing protein [unclassified Arthrobacter]MBE0010267.1 glycosyl hydrolase [Arthrobacter sp. AET 35A]NOJ64144.1 glycosyl hydrolase [Arthrobacter sp. 147(2020)]